MAIQKVMMRGFRGLDKDISLSERTVIVGPNGSGKSSISHAAILSLRGYVPGEDKRAQELFSWASAPVMGVGVVVGRDGVSHEVKRVWRLKKGSVSASCFVDGVDSDDLSVLGEPVPVDLAEVYGLSDRELRKLIMRVVAGEDKAAAFLGAVTDEEKNRAAWNAARAKAKQAGEAVARLVEEVATVGSPGTTGQLEAEIAKLEVQEREFADIVSRGQANDEMRAKSAVDVPAIKARIDDLAGDISQQHLVIAELVAKRNEVEAAAREFAQQAVSEYVSCKIGMALDFIPEAYTTARSLLVPFTSVGQDDIRDKMGRLSTTDANLGRNLEATRSIVDKMAGEVQSLRGQLKAASGVDGAIGPGVDPEIEKALTAVRLQMGTLRDQVRKAIRRDTLGRELEKARIDQAKAEADVEAKSAAMKKAVEQQASIAEAVSKAVAERLQAILPASLTPEYRDVDGKISLGLIKNGAFIPRSGLGGAERAQYDMAVSRLIGGDDAAVFVEAAEMSDVTFRAFLEGVSLRGQLVVMRWVNDPECDVSVPDGWSVVRMG